MKVLIGTKGLSNFPSAKSKILFKKFTALPCSRKELDAFYFTAVKHRQGIPHLA